jgi:hypothetical protein
VSAGCSSSSTRRASIINLFTYHADKSAKVKKREKRKPVGAVESPFSSLTTPVPPSNTQHTVTIHLHAAYIPPRTISPSLLFPTSAAPVYRLSALSAASLSFFRRERSDVHSYVRRSDAPLYARTSSRTSRASTPPPSLPRSPAPASPAPGMVQAVPPMSPHSPPPSLPPRTDAGPFLLDLLPATLAALSLSTLHPTAAAAGGGRKGAGSPGGEEGLPTPPRA